MQAPDEKQTLHRLAQLEEASDVAVYDHSRPDPDRPSLPDATMSLPHRVLRRVKSPSALAVLAMLLVCSYLLVWQGQQSSLSGLDTGSQTQTPSVSRRVPLEAHIMSKCPDAKDCLHDLLLPAMQRIEDKVAFTLSYIGTPTDHDDGIACKHGPPECLGNMLELCAAALYPAPKTYLGFTMCLTRSYEDIPARHLVEDCALEHGIDFARLNGCVSSDDGYGVGLLRDSVRLDSQIRCIRDGAQWKDCPGGFGVEDLVRDVERLYSSSGAA
ncbi:MAG: hypothetical protein M1832_005368 [Thelocarpon impressellum]|nr:MAG: hypothetical protein M1832_005368 [Thelocarpon impressellum]